MAEIPNRKQNNNYNKYLGCRYRNYQKNKTNITTDYQMIKDIQTNFT